MRILQAPSYKALIGLLFLVAQVSHANPAQHQVIEGAATVQHEANKTTIHQTSEKAIIHWDSFNIQSHETTHFQQPQGGVALNRINPSGGFSQIDGRLTATGTIILINGAGIHFGPGAYVNVGSLIAPSANISNENFLAGKYVFDQPYAKPGSIVNKGHIKAADYGLVALIGPHVENHGLIEAKMGTIALGSGNKATLSFNGGDLIHFAVEDSMIDPNHPQVKRGVKNTGKIYADGGKVLVHAASASNVLDKVVNMQGIVSARSVEQRNGKIILHAGPYGKVKMAGRLDVSGRGAGSRGGKIKVAAKKVEVKGGSLEASGHSGGGLILLGSESPKLQAPVMAERTVVSADAVLTASALNQGDGGQIIIRAKDNTTVQGELLAQGAKGGSVETSSGRFLNIDGIGVNLTATEGQVGTWTLGSQGEIFIRDKMLRETQGFEQSFTILDSYALEGNLATANVKVETRQDNSEYGGNISVEDKLAWHSPTTLTLSAYRDVSMPKAIISNDAGGSLILQADNTGTGKGQLRLRPPGSIPSQQVVMSGSRLAVIYSGKKSKYNYIRMEDTPAPRELNLGQGSRYEGRTYEEYLKKFAAPEVSSSSSVLAPNLQDSWVHLEGTDDEAWVSVPHPKPVSIGLQEEKSQLGDSWLTVDVDEVKSLTASEHEGFELLSESELRQLESIQNLHNSPLSSPRGSSLVPPGGAPVIDNQEQESLSSSWASLASLDEARALSPGSPLSPSLVHVGQDLGSSGSSWDSLASLAALQEREVSPSASQLMQPRLSSSQANRFLTQSLEPLPMDVSLGSLSLGSLEELLALHPDNLTPPPVLQASIQFAALPMPVALPAPPVLALPLVLQQPQVQATPANETADAKWVAAPWEVAAAVSPLSDPEEEKEPLWVIEGEGV